MNNLISDIVIVGAGSAGLGALSRILAMRRPEDALTVTVVERNPGFGGTSTYGGVNNWEPGIAGNGVHLSLAEALLADSAAGIGHTQGDMYLRDGKFWADSRLCADPYAATLRRQGLSSDELRRFQFEPGCMETVMRRQVENESGLTLLFGCECGAVDTAGTRITTLYVTELATGRQLRIKASLVLDCTADIVVARLAGCRTAYGEDAREDYDEPGAPTVPKKRVNGVTQVFRITPSGGESEKIPDALRGLEDREWNEAFDRGDRIVCCAGQYPCGDVNINMLPTMNGEEYAGLDSVLAQRLCRARAWRFWFRLKETAAFSGWRMHTLFPMLGVREGHRLVGRCVLTEQDLRAGIGRQADAGRCIAYADHALDTHGTGGGSGEFDRPYGIPYDCLLPRECDNLLVACRGASFSHIAASSARLSRTMMALGEAAGAAAVFSLRDKLVVGELNVEKLRIYLQISELEKEICRQWGL